MTLFDYIVLFVLGCSVVIGLLRGLVKELLSLASWILAFIVANAYSHVLAAMIPVPGDSLRLIVAFIALFIGVRLLMGLVGMLFDALLKATGLTLADRGLGALFGLARGIVFVLAGVMVCGMTDLPKQAFWRQAQLSPMAESGVRLVKPHLPEALAQHVHY